MKTVHDYARDSHVMQNLLADKAAIEKESGWIDNTKAVYGKHGDELGAQATSAAATLKSDLAALHKWDSHNSGIAGEIASKKESVEGIEKDLNGDEGALAWFLANAAYMNRTQSRLETEIKEMEGKLVPVQREKAAISAGRREVDSLNRRLKETKGFAREIDLAQAYGVTVDKVINHQAIAISLQMAQCAENAGTTLDKMVLASGQAHSFAYGMPTREVLDSSIAEARGQKGKYDVSPEELAYRQFINQVVIPHQDFFEIYAGKIDDLHIAGLGQRGNSAAAAQAAKSAAYPKLEILGQKTLSLSGRRNVEPAPIKTSKFVSEDQAAERHHATMERANELVKALDLSAATDSGTPIQQRLANGLHASDRQLSQIDGIFSSIADDLVKLSADKRAHETQASVTQQQLTAGIAKNEKLDDKIAATEQDIKLKSASQSKQTFSRMIAAAAFSLGTTVAKHSTAGAAAGSIVPGVGTAVGAAAGVASGLINFMSDTSRQANFAIASHSGTNEEQRIKQEFIESLRAQKIDVDKHKTQLDEIYGKIEKATESAEMQEMLSDNVKAQRVIKAYVARTILLDGNNNTLELKQFCDENKVPSVDSFLASFKGRTGNALERFCLGVANTNDMRVIIAESNALTGKDMPPHEVTLKALVEEGIKPHVGSYLTRASKIDKIYQTNLLNFGAAVYSEREMVRDASDHALGALFANEFGMSSIGALDVRHHFDHYRTRHGGKYLYDTKVNDGQVKDTTPARKAVSTLSSEDMDAFTDKATHDMAHASPKQPEMSDMFLRVCGYEYFLPQAVRTAGVNNIFATAPEAPAAYPMANNVINNFLERMSLGPIQDYRGQVGDKLDSLIADTFIDFFAKLGEIHKDDPTISQHRNRLHDASLGEKYAPVFSSYQRRITNDATQRFDVFMGLYKRNLERTLEEIPASEKAVLEAQIARIPEQSRAILNPPVMKPDSHTARLRAAYEDNLFDNMLRADGAGRPR